MKNNLSYYRHEVNSHNHWKFKTLRRKYQWAGEGKFWALNNMIGESEGCKLDISNPDKKASIAADLDFDISEFDEYLKCLITTCKLVIFENGYLTTPMTQENLTEVSDKRERQRNWKKQKSTQNTEKSTSTEQRKVVENEQSKVKESKVKESIRIGDGPVDFLVKMRDRYLVSNPNYSASDEDFSAMFEIFEFIRGQTKILRRLYELSTDEEQELQSIWDKWVIILVKKYSKKSLSEIAKFKKTEISNWAKEGLPENKSKSEKNGHDKGTQFNDDFTEVFFSDGTSQRLNADQSAQAKHGLINPKAIVKGIFN